MDIIERYLEEVLEANETTNLTRIVSRESAESCISKIPFRG